MSQAGFSCIYCGDSADEKTSEHIISDWTGCRVTLEGKVCRDCNSRFGSGPEGELHRLLKPFAEICKGQPGPKSRGRTVWEGQIEGETRPFRIDLESGKAIPTAPVVSKEVLEDGRTKYVVTGTEAHSWDVKKCLERKGEPITFGGFQDPKSPEIDLSATYDWSGIYENGPLTAAAKFAANYSWWCLGDLPISRAFSEQAHRFLVGEGNPCEQVAPVCSFDLLNRIGLSPPQHSLLLAPTRSSGVYCVVIALFGLVPYIVRTPATSQRIAVAQGHRLGTSPDQPAEEPSAMFGSPMIDLEELWPDNDQARNRWILQIAENVFDHLSVIGERNGFAGLEFERIISRS